MSDADDGADVFRVSDAAVVVVAVLVAAAAVDLTVAAAAVDLTVAAAEILRPNRCGKSGSVSAVAAFFLHL